MRGGKVLLAASVALLLALQPAVASAAGGRGAKQMQSWLRVRALPLGTDLIVEDARQGRVEGSLEEVTDDALRLRAGGEVVSFARGEIRKIYLGEAGVRVGYAARGAWLGALAGLGVGVLVAREQGRDGDPSFAPLTLSAVGAGVGAGVGALAAGRRKEKGILIYERK
jgi:hypothetical protein